MKKRFRSKRLHRVFLKLTSLIVVASLFWTSSSVIALDGFDASAQLREQTFTLTPEEGVTVTLSGVMPLHGYAEAEPADVEGEDVLHAYDITIHRDDGTEFEPDSGNPIAVSFKSAAIERAIADEDTALTVGHIDDSGKETDVKLTEAEGSEVCFDAESFSVYVIYEHEQDGDLLEPRKTFYFLSDHFTDYEDATQEQLHGESASGLYESELYRFPNTAGEMVSTQIVKSGETLHRIVMPDNSEFGGFYGWYVVNLDFDNSVEATIRHSNGAIPEGTALTVEQLTHFVYSWGDNPENVTADTVIQVSQDENVFLAPLFYNFRFVEFLEPDDGSGARDVAMRKIVVLGENRTAEVELCDVVAEPLPNSGEAFYGWQYNGSVYQTRMSTGEVIEQFLTLTDADFPDGADTVQITPVFKKTDFIEFDLQAAGAEPVPAMRSFLYDPNVAEQERATISQLPSTRRNGYIFDGWYAHFTDQNGDPVEQQVSMGKQSPDDTSNCAIIPTEGSRIHIDNDPDGSYLYHSKLYLRRGMTLYAHWRKVNTADYKVVIWKQKVTDDKNATDANKHYDYYSYTLMTGADTESVVLDLPAYQAKHFEALGGTDFECFHYSRTEVVVNGVAYDSITQHDQCGVAPDDSTVVNVYYDRDLMTIRFDYSSRPDVEFTGLYEQTFAQNGYSWDTVSNVQWKAGTTTQTLLDAFTKKDNPYVLKQNGTPGTSIIYHYKQGLDGKYSTDDRYTAYGSGGTFNFTNKFHGFTVRSYTKKTFDENGGTVIQPGGSLDSPGSPLHVYHERKKFTLTFADYRTESNSPGEPNDWVITGVPFEKPIADVIAEHPALMTPPERDNFDFVGWYLDAGCTKEAAFSEEIMPAANRIYYAKWELKHYIVEIDPDGGEMQAGDVFSAYTDVTGNGTELTYNRVLYGGAVLEPQHMERSYAPAHNGEYVYVNIRLAPTLEEAAANWKNRLPEEYRGAFYCKLTELETVYNTCFAGLESGGEQLLSRDDFMAYCVNGTQRYRKIEADEVGRYVLDGWRKVNADGTTSSEVYHFGDPVTQHTRVRAVWKRTGAYYLQYDPFDSRYNVGRDVMVDDEMMHNPVLYDPSDPGDPASAAYYHDHAQAVILHHPTYIPAHYIFRGWELLSDDGTKTGYYYAPGDAFVVDSAYADRQGIIHFEAAYEPETESVRIVETAALTLDANHSYGGYAVRGDLDIHPDSVYADLDNYQVIFTDQPNNFEVHLKDYYKNFLNEQGFLLIGWSTTPDNPVPDFAADAVIGVDTTDNENDILYAVWEPMYYLTIENHSTDYNITFDLQFTGYSGTVYGSDNNSEISTFIRKVFDETYTDDSIISVVEGNGKLTVTIKKAVSEDTPASVKLVLPQGANVQYQVSGDIANAKKDDNTPFTSFHDDKLSIYNSGGPGDQFVWKKVSGRGNWYNLANKQKTGYDITGTMKLGSEGQTVAFYTGTVDTVDVYIQGLYYDIASGDWLNATEGQGPSATLNFEEHSGMGSVSYDGTTGIKGINIIRNTAVTFAVIQSYTNTNSYKFIGWYAQPSAAPGDITLDGKAGLDGASKVRNIPVPNTSETYYALYVPKADGDLVISHNEKESSIGYPKLMNVTASYNNGQPAYNEEETAIVSIADRPDKVHTQVSVRVSETDDPNTVLQITLGARPGYGCVYNDTYEGTRKLEGDAVDSGDPPVNVYMDPNDTSSPCEPQSLWIRTITKTADELFEDSETVKGLKVLHPLNYYTDFARKYEIVYNYIFRDGVTPRKYLVTGTTAEHNTTEDFKRFVTESAPYVTNFGENLSWNTATIRIENLFEKGKIYASMDAAQYNNAKANVYVHSYNTNFTETWSIDVGKAFPEDERPTAPLIIDNPNGGTPLQFYRWKITEAEKGSVQTPKLVGYCYYNEFTFMVWDDYDIDPEYVPMTGDEYERYYPDDEQTAYVNIDHLQNTRNQWVDLESDNQTIKYDEAGNATYNDALISDYSIIFIDYGLRINTHPENYKVGLLYEIVGEVDDNGVTTESDYTQTDEEYRKSVINAVLKTSKQNGTVKSGGKAKFYYSKFDPAELTHDNRYEFYRGIDNLRSEEGLLNPNAKYIFKVYAYMKLNDDSIYQSEGVDVQLYDLAIRTSISG